MKHYFLDDGQRVTLDDSKPIGSGGEGSVYKLHKNPDVLAKIYLKRALDRMPDIEDKIKAMVNQKPGLLSYKGLTIIAWPTHVLYDDSTKFAGYLMSRVQAKNQLSHVITPTLQKKKFPGITWYDRLVISINLALVLSYLHKNDTVIGDINTSDFFVYPGFEIGLVDTDSFQVKTQSKLFHCKVFTPDYTPPEVIEAKKKSTQEVTRLPNHDNYGLAILIFQILNAGVHPFSARIKNKPGFDGNAINYCMENEIFPYLGKDASVIPPKNALPYSYFPKDIQDLFNKTFMPYKQNVERPTAEAWVSALRVLKENIKKCRRNKSHYYPNHFHRCPHCERERTKDYDYLVEYFKVISKSYVVYSAEDRHIKVDVGNVFAETITAKVYKTKKRSEHAVFFHEKMKDKYEFVNRAKALKSELNKVDLRAYVALPLTFISKDDREVGYVIHKQPKRIRISTLLSQNKFGKVKLTDKAKVKLARNVAIMFRVLEKHSLTCEFNQLYVSESLQPFLPDLVMLGNKQLTYPRIPMSHDQYRPQEFYLSKVYSDYLEKEKRRREEEEKREQLRLQEAARLEAKAQEEAKRLAETQASEAVKEPVDKEEPVYEVTEEVAAKTMINKPSDSTDPSGFAFETSLTTVKKEEPVKEVIPPKVEFTEDNKQISRFHLGVIIHMILHRVHPFSGTLKGSKKPVAYFIENNTYLQDESTAFARIDASAVLAQGYPKYYQRTLKKTLFVKDPTRIKRPKPSVWIRTLNLLRFDLQKCSVSEYHYYHKSLSKCPVCYESEAADHDSMRQFYYAYKTNALDRFTALNAIANQFIVIGLLLYGLTLLHSNAYQGILSSVLSIDFVQKWDTISEAIRLDGFIDMIARAVNAVKDLYTLIFGGSGNGS